MLVEEMPESQGAGANNILDVLNNHEGETLTKHGIKKIMEEIWGGH